MFCTQTSYAITFSDQLSGLSKSWEVRPRSLAFSASLGSATGELGGYRKYWYYYPSERNICRSNWHN